MQFYSTRDRNRVVTSSEAIAQGLSDEGGLFVPASFPQVDVQALCALDYPEMAAVIVGEYLTDYSKEFLAQATKTTYGAAFGGKAGYLAPVSQDVYALELWHGPTCAFKDYALQLMPKLLVEAKKMLGGLSFMLRGLPFLYQGQELGLENATFTDIGQVDDISTIDEYQVALNAGCTKEQALAAINRYSRDHARMPYPWSDAPNGGFTTGKPWLMVNPEWLTLNLAAEKQQKDSVWHFYKQLIALRKNPEYSETVVYGVFEPWLREQNNLMAYLRKGEKTLLVAGNYQTEPQEMKLPAPIQKVLMNLSLIHI